MSISFALSRRRIAVLLWGFLLLAAASTVRAQSEQVPSEQEVSQMDRVGRWKLINTAIFALLLGWGLAKTAPRFFNARSADIQKAIKDATGLKMDADLRYSEMDRKMATLSEEVNRLRQQGEIEMDREHSRIRAEGESERDRMRRGVAAEIDAIRAENRLKLRQLTADQALALAQGRLQERGAERNNELLQDFIRLVTRDGGDRR